MRFFMMIIYPIITKPNSDVKPKNSKYVLYAMKDLLINDISAKSSKYLIDIIDLWLNPIFR